MFTHAKSAAVLLIGAALALIPAGLVAAAKLPDNGCLQPVQFDCVETFPYASQLDRTDQRSLPLDHRYVYNYTGQGVNIYVVDDGIDISDPDFGGRASNDYSAFDDRAHGIFDHRSCNHATLVALVAAGRQWGVAKRASVHSVKVINACDRGGAAGDVLKGLQWVIDHAQPPAIVNMSMGTAGNDIRVHQKVQALLAKRILVVAAAGQDGVNACGIMPASVACCK